VNEEEKIPEINLIFKVIKVEPRTIELKGWYGLNRNGFNLLTRYRIVYWWYKFWWWIKPPKMVCYHSVGVEEELKKLVEKQISDNDIWSKL